MIVRNALIRGIRITKHLIRATTKDINDDYCIDGMVKYFEQENK